LLRYADARRAGFSEIRHGQETAGTQGCPAERQKSGRLRHSAARQKRCPVKAATADDYTEQQAAIKACSALVERPKALLQTPPQEQSAKVALWRLGLEQAIAAIEEYRGEVQDLLV
jgi:hypothetical protein